MGNILQLFHEPQGLRLAFRICWGKGAANSGISSLPCRSASEATPGQVVNLRPEGAAHSQNSGQLQGDTPWKTKMIWGKIKLLCELLLPWPLLEGNGTGRVISFNCPLEKWSAVVKISQWVTRHYQLSAENDCTGGLTCPSSQGPDELPAAHRTDGFSFPHVPNFPSKKRIHHGVKANKYSDIQVVSEY